MSDQPNIAADTNDFEFEALAEAKNYRQALFDEFRQFLKGNVVEVGAGIGQMTDYLARIPEVKRALALEPEPAYCVRHRARAPDHEIIQGTVAALPPGAFWDAILSINVLEHIRDDEGELKSYSELLRERRGVLCLFVPARPEIYGPIDKDFGHFRRYTAPGLRLKLLGAGFDIVRLDYFNCAGYFAWWVNFRLLKKRGFERGKVRFYDRIIFPAVHAFESKIARPPFGQSLIVAARSSLSRVP